MQQPDLQAREEAVVRVLRRIGRRLLARELARALAVGLMTAAVVSSTIAWRTFWPAVAAGAGAGLLVMSWQLVRRRHAWSPAAAAARVEGFEPRAANVVVTAQELIAHRERARPWIRARVLEDAMGILDGVPAARVAPVSRDLLWGAAALALVTAVLSGIPQRAAVVVRDAAARASRAAGRALSGEPMIAVSVTPPSYLKGVARTLRNPDRIDAVRGSRVRVTVEGAGAWRVRFGATPLTPLASRAVTTVETVLSESGYFGFEREGEAGARARLIPVVVAPDAAPVVRIDAPAKDLLVPRAEGTVAVTASASDDFGLGGLEVRYTKVSGSGEQFEFTEGTLPVGIARSSGRAWTATGAFALGRLGLQPGDSLVYRAVARDGRSGDAGLASSDTYFIEVAGPGQVALEGFELPPDRERYALSQQMVLLKIQRLRARERSMTRGGLEAAVTGIAAEQRAVRANFVFLMGGEVEDEEQEAEHSHEIQEGRLENSARREIMTAIQHMGRVEQALAAVDTAAALPAARAAVDALQRAFGRNRYFLRTLPVRSRIDPSRRLSGELDDAADWARKRSPASEDAVQATARRILAALLNRGGAAAPDAAMLTRLAEDALTAAPGAAEWQDLSARLIELRDAVAAGTPNDRVDDTLTAAVAALTTLVRRQAVPLATEAGDSPLYRRWAEERRRR